MKAPDAAAVMPSARGGAAVSLPPLSIVLALAVLAGAALLLALFLQHKLGPGWLFNSDSLYLPALYADLVERGGHWRDWWLTPAPYFFPDALLFFACMAVTGSVFAAVATFTVLQGLLTFLATWWLARRTLAASLALPAAACASLACFAAAATMEEPFWYMLVSGYHWGALLMMLAGAGLVIGALQSQSQSQSRSRHVVALFVLSALAGLSDRIDLVQFAAPAVVMLLALARRGTIDKRAARELIVAIVAGSLVGLALHRLVIPHVVRVPVGIGWRQLPSNVQMLGRYALNVARADAMAFACIPVFFGACLFAAMRRRAAPASAARVGHSFLVGYGALAAIISTAAALVNSVSFTSRYLIPTFALPVLLVPVVMASLVPARRQHLAALALVALCVWPLARLVDRSIAPPTTLAADYYPAELACIDAAARRHQVHDGIAEYWDAKSTSLLSRERLNVVQVYADLSPMRWISSDRWMRERYDFALIDRRPGQPPQPDTRLIETLNGPPAVIEHCGPIDVWVYGRGRLATNGKPR